MKIRYVLLIILLPYYFQAQSSWNAFLTGFFYQADAVNDDRPLHGIPVRNILFKLIAGLSTTRHTNLAYAPLKPIGYAF